MPLTKIYDMAYEVSAHQVTIEQDCGAGETHAVYLHPIHVRLIASDMGLLKGDADAWQRVEALERRLNVLRDRIQELDARLWGVPVYPPGSNERDPDCIYSEATLELANEFCMDTASVYAEAMRTHSDRTAPASETHGQPMANPADNPRVSAQRDLLEGAQQ